VPVNLYRLLAAGLVPTMMAACGPAPREAAAPAVLVERARVSMGSELRLTAWTSDEANAAAAFEHVFEDFEYLDRMLSVWHPDSDVSRLNASAGQGAIRMNPITIEILQIARGVSEQTGGKFDVTFGALSGLWKFDHDQDERVPPRDEVLARLPLVDFRQLEIDVPAGTARLRQPGMRVHLGGIGKGYAVDRAATILRSHGITDFMIQAGGDLYVGGRHGERPWRGAIKDPRGDGIFAAIDLRNETLSTSGDYERFFFVGGRRYHHILDPDTGEPARSSRSVTIVTGRAVMADALSTGVFVAGPEAGMRLIEALRDVEGVIVTADNRVMVSSGLAARLERLAPPSEGP
jgi:thiamine biosynthesis lipoprotein